MVCTTKAFLRRFRMKRLAAIGLVLLFACGRKDPPTASVDAATTAEAGATSAIATTEAGATTASESAAPRTRPVWIPKLESEEDFLHYSKQVGAERFTKFVVDLKSKAIYYVDADLYPM